IGPALVDVHGQGETVGLLRSSEQAAVLDRFGGAEDLAESYAALHRELRAAEDATKAIEESAHARQDRLEFVRYQIKELEDAAPEAGEEGALEREILLRSRSSE